MKKGGKCRARITGEKWLGSLAAKVSKSEKDAVSAQTLGWLQPFIAVLPQEGMGHLASSGPT
jgi:hypothetical protein